MIVLISKDNLLLLFYLSFLQVSSTACLGSREFDSQMNHMLSACWAYLLLTQEFRKIWDQYTVVQKVVTALCGGNDYQPKNGPVGGTN